MSMVNVSEKRLKLLEKLFSVDDELERLQKQQLNGFNNHRLMEKVDARVDELIIEHASILSMLR